MLAAFVIGAFVLLAASSGAVFKPGEWYDTLKKPSWTPPDWAFPVVWTVLYIMIGYAGWLVWQAAGVGLAMILWAVQLVLNGAWSWLFFGRKRMDLAFAEVCALWLSTAGFILAAYPVSAVASLLFVPYLAWVTTAAALNFTVWRMNPDQVSGPQPL
ncbi:MAG: tryptophan-rich sensory protein [Roseibium sp.]|nr:tryptophan-rich sensory protein [Roseibium sp.]